MRTTSVPDENGTAKVARLLIADDDPIFRDGLRALLKEDRHFAVVGDSSDGTSAIRVAQDLKPDLLLLDWTLSRQDGMRALKDLAAALPSLRTLLLKVPLNSKDILQALECSVAGIVLKNSATETLFRAIRTVAAGQYWVGHESVANLMQAVRDLSPSQDRKGRRPEFGLTSREREIIDKVVAGYSNGEIAAHFTLSEHTVKHHISNVFDKLGVSTRLELAFFAVNHRLTQHEM